MRDDVGKLGPKKGRVIDPSPLPRSKTTKFLPTLCLAAGLWPVLLGLVLLEQQHETCWKLTQMLTPASCSQSTGNKKKKKTTLSLAHTSLASPL